MQRGSIRHWSLPTVLLFAAGITGCSKKLDRYVRSFESVTICGVNVVDVDNGAILREQNVFVVDGRIRSITPGLSVVNAGSTIDGRGRYLLPGLADMHVHHYSGEYDDDDLFLYLVNGVTTVRNMAGSERDLEAKKKIEAGTLIGPRYYTAGPQLGWWIDTVEKARAAVEKQHRAGYDFIKVYSGFVKPAYQAIIETGQRLNLPVVGHPQVRLGEDENLRLRSIEHLEESLDLFGRRSPDPVLHGEFAARLARANVFVTPTLHIWTFFDCVLPAGRERLLRRQETRFLSDVWYRKVNDPDDPSYLSLNRIGYRELKKTRDLGLEFVPFLHRNGVPLLLGTDAVWFAVPGFSIHDELGSLVSAGLSPLNALRTGTTNVASFFGPEYNSGRIAVGKNADLLLLDANPLEDIKNSRRIAGVMIGRHWIDRAGIEKILLKLRKR